MLHFLKRLLFGQKAHETPDVDIPSLDLGTATLDELVAANIKLGEQVDALRAQRRAINQRAAELRG